LRAGFFRVFGFGAVVVFFFTGRTGRPTFPPMTSSRRNWGRKADVDLKIADA
jgi:hypothetical protein